MTATKTSLAGKLAAVMAAITAIPKTGRNTAQNYDYVEDSKVLDVIRTELGKQNVAIIASATDIDVVPYVSGKGNPGFLTTVKGFVQFIDAESGESYNAYGIGQGADPTDKGVYKALTGLFKYALLKTFLVPTGDDPERDEKPERLANANRSAAANEGAQSAGLTDSQRRLLMARFKEVGLENGQRTAFTADVCGKFSSKQMDSADLDKVLEALKNPELVQKAKDEVKPA